MLEKTLANTTHMRREINEIPAAASRLLTEGYADVQSAAAALRQAKPDFLVTIARGSSDHAANYLKYAAELLLGLPVASVGPSVASIYQAKLKVHGGACLVISQSGKSPDILELAKQISGSAAPMIALCNTSDAPLMNLAGHSIDILAGPEQSVAATKSFVSCVLAGLAILAEWAQDAALISAISALPEQLARAVALDWPDLRRSFSAKGPALILGRGPTYALACEAALKLKETCAIHAEAYSSAELIHGPIEIVDQTYTTLCLTVRDAAEPGLLKTAQTLAAMGAASFATSPQAKGAVGLQRISTGHPLTDPLPLIVAFYTTIERLSRDLGRNPDLPRALSKVTLTV